MNIVAVRLGATAVIKKKTAATTTTITMIIIVMNAAVVVVANHGANEFATQYIPISAMAVSAAPLAANLSSYFYGITPYALSRGVVLF